MFDIGIMELGLIAVVALLVIGPERLPAVARTVGFWFGKIRKFVSSVQDDFNREVIKSDELKRLVEEQSKIKDVHEIIEKTLDESRKTVSVGAGVSTKDSAEAENSGEETRKETPQLDSGNVDAGRVMDDESVNKEGQSNEEQTKEQKSDVAQNSESAKT